MNPERSQRQHHLRCAAGEIAPYVLLPGDPERAALIASHLDDRQHVATHREFTTYTGSYGGVPVSVTSTGIGGPSTAIAVEELVKVGAKTLIRVGTCGAMQPSVDPGDVIVATGAIRDEGTSDAYLPAPFPAVSTLHVADGLRSAAVARKLVTHVGVLHSKDSFYAQREPSRMPIADALHARWDAWIAGGALGSEMESATLFIVGAALGIDVGSICMVASSHDSATRLSQQAASDGISEVIDATLDAVRDIASSPARSSQGMVNE